MSLEDVHKPIPLTSTTKRGFATASVSFGIWGMLVFWWYPFGAAVATLGVIFGLISVALGFRIGRDGEHLAWAGVVFGSIGVSMAIGLYRFSQIAFEGAPTSEWFQKLF